MRSGIGVLLLAGIVLPVICHAEAGPPMITDDPGTPGKGHFEVNTAFTYEERPQAKSVSAPLLDINYGLFDHVQLKLQVPWELSRIETHSASGLGESIAGIKWRFLDEEEHGFAMSIYPQLEFRWPAYSSSRNPDDKIKHLILPLDFEKALGPVTLGLEFGLDLSHKARPQNFGGLVLGHRFNENFELLGEVRETSGPDFHRDECVVNAGFRLKVNSLMSIIGSGGTTVHAPGRNSPRVLSYLALQFTF
jgi:hypothetical protein